jgi:hypothetical protein
MQRVVGDFAKSSEELGPLVETRLVYESPTAKGHLRTPLPVEVRRGRKWFFAVIPRLEIVEEGRTPDDAVTRCFETLFEIMKSYAHMSSQQLSQDARDHWKRLQAVAELINDGCHPAS